MKKKLLNFTLTILVVLILSLFLPWWSVMVAAFISSISISLKRASVFFIPFFAIACYWFVSAFYLSSSNDFILARKVAVLFSLNGNAYLLMLVTAIIGGLAAGIAAIFGKQCSLLYSKKRKGKVSK
ncbi:MAG: hypothetical protein ACI837_001528 [Crocinitomicaceae bacterium]|jgi:hypothetical protein